MHDLLEDYAHSNGLRDVSPKLKMLIGLGSILISVLSPSPIGPIAVAFTMSLAVLILAKIPWRFYSKLLLVPLSFAILSSAVVIFVTGIKEPLLSWQFAGYTVAIREDGIDLGILLMARTFGGMCSMFFVALTTPMMEIFSVLRAAGLPESLVELSMLVYRYIFVLMDEAEAVHSAQSMRLGYSGLQRSIMSISMLSSVLFIRAWERGEKLMVSMDSRCYSGKLPLQRTAPVTPAGLIAAVGYLASMAALAFMSRTIGL